MARKDYPFSKRDTNKYSNFMAGILARLIVTPFAILESTPNESNSMDNQHISKSDAIIYIIVAILLTPVFIPIIKFAFNVINFPLIGPFIFFALIAIPLIIYVGAIYSIIKSLNNEDISESTAKHTNTDIRSIYEIMVDTIAQESLNDKNNKIKEAYYNTTKLNKSIEEQKQSIYQKINKYKQKLKWLNYFPILRNKYNNTIKTLLSEISNLENLTKEPIIQLNYKNINNTEYTENHSQIFLDINNYIYSYKKIDFRNLSKSRIQKRSFFKTNATPTLSVCFKSIQIYFYDNFMIIMSRKNFAIINYDDISIDCRIIPINPYPSKYIQDFKIVRTKREHTYLGGTPNLRFSNNYRQIFVEATVIDIGIFSQKIALIFNDKESAYTFISKITMKTAYLKKQFIKPSNISVTK